MQRRKRIHFQERLKRVQYIQTELYGRVCKALVNNSYVNFRTSYLADVWAAGNITQLGVISRHRVLCPLLSSFKIVSKKFRLSRFAFNAQIRANKIPNLLKRSW